MQSWNYQLLSGSLDFWYINNNLQAEQEVFDQMPKKVMKSLWSDFKSSNTCRSFSSLKWKKMREFSWLKPYLVFSICIPLQGLWVPQSTQMQVFRIRNPNLPVALNYFYIWLICMCSRHKPHFSWWIFRFNDISSILWPFWTLCFTNLLELWHLT